jgi:hypothetical protein
MLETGDGIGSGPESHAAAATKRQVVYLPQTLGVEAPLDVRAARLDDERMPHLVVDRGRRFAD